MREKDGAARRATGAEPGGSLAGEQVTEHVFRCPDGYWRWYYELPMLKAPVILYTAWTVLGIALGAVYLFVLIASAATDSLYGWTGFWDLTWVFILLLLVLGALSALAYLAVAAVYGWRYVVLFEMNEALVRHIQVPRQFKKAQALAWLTALAGLAAKSPVSTAAGVLAASRSTSTSEFKNVRLLVLRPRRQLIRINRLLGSNQIYAAPEDFEFVREFIVSHCPEAKIR